MTTWTEMVLVAVLSLSAFAAAAALGRAPSSRLSGVALGAVGGALVHICAMAAIGFLGRIMPFGQLDFWVANQLLKLASLIR